MYTLLLILKTPQLVDFWYYTDEILFWTNQNTRRIAAGTCFCIFDCGGVRWSVIMWCVGAEHVDVFTTILHTPVAAAAPLLHELIKMAKCIADERVADVVCCCCFGERKKIRARDHSINIAMPPRINAGPSLNSLKRCCRCSAGVCKPSKSIFTHVCVSLTMDGILPIQMHRSLSRFIYFYLRPYRRRKKK